MAQSANNKMRTIFPRLKQSDDIGKKSNVVYEVPCGNCDQIYIGQTKTYLDVRMREHEKTTDKIHGMES